MDYKASIFDVNLKFFSLIKAAISLRSNTTTADKLKEEFIETCTVVTESQDECEQIFSNASSVCGQNVTCYAGFIQNSANNLLTVCTELIGDASKCKETLRNATKTCKLNPDCYVEYFSDLILANLRRKRSVSQYTTLLSAADKFMAYCKNYTGSESECEALADEAASVCGTNESCYKSYIQMVQDAYLKVCVELTGESSDTCKEYAEEAISQCQDDAECYKSYLESL